MTDKGAGANGNNTGGFGHGANAGAGGFGAVNAFGTSTNPFDNNNPFAIGGGGLFG